MVQFLIDQRGKGVAPLSKEERVELSHLREESEKLRVKLKEKARQTGIALEDESDEEPNKKKDRGDSSGSDDSDEEGDAVAEIAPPEQRMAMAKKSRTSVSAEAFGKYHVKQAFKPQVIVKSDEVKNKIKQRLEQAFMFMALDENELQVVIDAMDEKKAAADEFLIKEGDAGDCLFIVESGELKCTKVIGGENKFLKKYVPGDVFGELALLYNAPRAASI